MNKNITLFKILVDNLGWSKAEVGEIIAEIKETPPFVKNNLKLSRQYMLTLVLKYAIKNTKKGKSISETIATVKKAVKGRKHELEN